MTANGSIGAAPAQSSPPRDSGPLTESRLDVDALASAVAERIAPAAPIAGPALVDADAAATQLAVPASWVRAEARADRIPHVRLGRYVRFDPVELDAWWRERRRGPWRTGRRPVSAGVCEPVGVDDRGAVGARDTSGATDNGA